MINTHNHNFNQNQLTNNWMPLKIFKIQIINKKKIIYSNAKNRNKTIQIYLKIISMMTKNNKWDKIQIIKWLHFNNLSIINNNSIRLIHIIF